MKKFLRILILALTMGVITVGGLTACGEKTDTNSSGVSTSDESTSDESSTQKQDFVGLSFADLTVSYDGQPHTIVVAGAPEDATITYTNEGPYTDVGTYKVSVTVSKEGYNDYTSTATLTITPIDFTGITFNDETFEFDGLPHTIAIVGSLPSTADVTYSSNVENVTNSATEIGEYVITAVITDKNHNQLVLEAVMKITANSAQRFMACSDDGQLFFQNAIDDDDFYLYDDETGSIVKISGENAVDIIPYDGGVMYISKALLSNSIKTAKYENNNASVTNLYTAGGARYVQVSGQTAYYAVNSLLNDKSGIYKTDFSGEEPVTTCLSVGKAKYLNLVGNQLYFADGANDDKLSVINTTGTNQARTLVVDAKIKNLICQDGALYYTVNNLLGDYIEKFTISNSVRRKLTVDAGESLTIIDDKLYYVNVDKFTTSVIGNGIYSVNISPLVDNNLPGEQVIDGGEYGVCSLTSDGENLYYYDVNGYKLIKYNPESEEAVNLLDGFVKPEPATPISTGSKMQTYNGNIYYLDIWDGKTLHCYNPRTKLNYAITADKVVDFNIIGDVLYVNMVSYLVNNDLYSVNLKTGGELTKISSYSAYEFVVSGDYLYYIEENAAGVKTAIHQCKLDGTEDVIVYDKGVSNLRVVNGKLYFIDGNNIYCYSLDTKTCVAIEVDGKEIHTTAFDTDGTYLYYRDMYGVLWANKRLSRCKLDGSDKVVMVEDIDPVFIKYENGYVYYYSDTTSQKKNGLFKVSATVSSTTSGTTLLAESSGYYAQEFVIFGNDLYFVDYKSQLAGDAHLYKVSLDGGTPVQVS